MRVGGRRTRLGFSQPLGKAPQVKQGRPQGIVKRIPGTTKIEYTNKKGRQFSFSIPVAEMIRPPEAASQWKELDISFCDTGELEEPMPSTVEDFLLHSDSVSITDNDSAAVVSLGGEELTKVGEMFKDYCRQYALMDTRGMKLSTTLTELNSGPDYEHYDRKLMRRRYWLSIRRTFEIVKELLWPALVDGEALDAQKPLLSAAEMLDILIWVEAANTFSVRVWREYDVVLRSEFEPISLTREVRVLAQRAREAQLLVPSSRATTEQRRSPVDDLITCIGLCKAHGVPIDEFLPDTGLPGVLQQVSAAGDQPDVSVADTIRLIHALQGEGGMTNFDCFMVVNKNETSAVSNDSEAVDEEQLRRLLALCAPCVRQGTEGMANVDEDGLFILFQLAVSIREKNRSFFTQSGSSQWDEERRAVIMFENLCVDRCRCLLYQSHGDQVVMSGDNTSIPLVDLQQHKESSHAPLLHYNVGRRYAQGLRKAKLGSRTSELTELIARLQSAYQSPHSAEPSGASELVDDLMRHVALQLRRGRLLGISEIIRVLHLLAPAVSSNNELLVKQSTSTLTSMGASIRCELEKPVSLATLASLLTGLSACQHVPACYEQLEAVLMRECLSNSVEPTLLNRILHAVAGLKGPPLVSRRLLDYGAVQMVQWMNDAANSKNSCHSLLLSLLEMMILYRHCVYRPLASLVLQMMELFPCERRSAEWPPIARAMFGVVSAGVGAKEEVNESLSALLVTEATADLLAGEKELLGGSGRDDLLIDGLVTFAALGIPVSTTLPSNLSSSLHPFATPRHALHVLESLEVLGLHNTFLHKSYIAYLQKHLETMRSAGESVSVSDDAVHLLVTVCRLEAIPPAMKEMAVGLLHTALLLLDAKDDRSASENYEYAHLMRKASNKARDESIGKIYECLRSVSATLS